jgi:probable O-glycosylation ligase (exosortase A-associated)
MLRVLLVSFLIALGTYYSLQAPFYALLFYLGNAYFRPEDWVSDDIIRSLNLSFSIGLYLVFVTLLCKKHLAWNGLITFCLLFLVQAILSVVFSPYAEYCWPYLLEFVKVAVISYLIVVLTTDFTRFRLVSIVIVLALGLEQGKQGWFYLITKPGGPNINPVPFLGDNNGVALGMLMLVPLVGLLYQTSHWKWGKTLWGILFVGCLYRALSTYSRGGFIAAIGMGVAWWLLSFRKLRIGIVIGLILVTIVPALPAGFWDRIDTIQTYNETKDASALGRLHFWEVARTMAAANPIAGVGFNGFNKAYDDFDFLNGAYGRQRSVHSSYFGVLAELGYPGLVIFIAILFLSLVACVRVRRWASTGRLPTELGKSAIALAAAMIAFIIGGAFLPSQYAENLWHIFGLTIALRRIATTSLVTQEEAERQSNQPIAA